MLLSSATVTSLLAPQILTATVTGTGVDLAPYADDVLVVLASGAASTADTLDVTLETSAASGSGYTAITGGAFAQVTDASTAGVQTLVFPVRNLSRYIRAVATCAGGSISIPAAVTITAVKQRN